MLPEIFPQLGFGFPLRVLEHLGGFQRERQGKILERVELLPVTLVAELDGGFHQRLESVIRHGVPLACGGEGLRKAW